MILLVSGATRTVARHPEVGILVNPSRWGSLAIAAATGRPWGADNDCFRGLDEEAYRRMLVAISKVDTSRFLWVTVPDVVGDAQATLNAWHHWYPQVNHLGLPAAFVAQDGLESVADQIQWHEMAAIFIGGSTEWKLSGHAERFMAEARRRGKWVHVGRVNTRRRVRTLGLMGLPDSIDGTAFSRHPDIKIPRGLAWAREARRQPCLF